MCEPAQEHHREQRRSDCGYRETRAPIPPLSVSRGRYLISPMLNPGSESIERSPAAEYNPTGAKRNAGKVLLNFFSKNLRRAGTDILRGIEPGSKDQRRRSLRPRRGGCFPSGSTRSQRAGRGGGGGVVRGSSVSRFSCKSPNRGEHHAILTASRPPSNQSKHLSS